MAGTLIGAMRVNLGLDGTQFAAGLGAAQARLTGFQKAAVAVAGRLTGVFAAMFTTGAATRAADAWSDMSSRVGIAVGSMERAPAVMARIVDIANRTYSELGQTAEGFIQNAASLRELGYSTRDVLDYTEALNNALVVSGAKGDRATAVQYALQKAMATGKLRGDDLNQVLTNGGKIAELLARALGTTRNGLIAMGREGKITSDVIGTALLGSMQELRDEADAMPATIGDAFVRIRTNLIAFIGQMDQATGTTGVLAKALLSLGDNIARAASYLTAFVGFIAGRWVAAFVAARLATVTLAGALGVLRAAVIRTGIGALVVGAGELLYWFAQLVKGAGGFGAALGLLKDVAAEVWDRIAFLFQGGVAKAKAALASIALGGVTAFGGLVESAVMAADRIVAVWEGTKAAVAAIWSGLPGTVGDFAFQAVNTVIAATEKMLNAITARINSWMDKINSTLAAVSLFMPRGMVQAIPKLGDVEFGGVDNPFRGQAAQAGRDAAAAFNDAMAQTWLSADSPFKGLRKDLQDAVNGLNADADVLLQAGMIPLESWQKLKDAVAGVKDEVTDTTGSLDRIGDAAEAAGGRGKAAIDRSKDALDRMKEALESVRSTIEGAFVSFVTGAKSFRQALADVLRKLAEMAASSAFNLIWGGKSGTGGIGGAIKKILGFAGGTDFAPGGLAWVGERGPELVNLPRGSQVFTAQQSRTMVRGSGGPLSINVNISGASGDRHIIELVQQGVTAGLSAFDRALPGRVRDINASPRAR